jgi:hypothetical protein
MTREEERKKRRGTQTSCDERRGSQAIMTRENERKERRGTQPSHDERRDTQTPYD